MQQGEIRTNGKYKHFVEKELLDQHSMNFSDFSRIR